MEREKTYTVKDLRPFDVIEVYVQPEREWGRGIVVRTYESGGSAGARVSGVLPDQSTFDIHIKSNSAVGRLLYRDER